MKPPKPRQLSLELDLGEGVSRDDLVVTDSNRAAVSLIDRWPDWPTPVAALAGPAGSGKTHLVAIWQAMSDAVLIDACDIDGEAVTLAASRAMVIDGADRPDLDETGLFHLINAVTAGGNNLLLTARRLPVLWGVGLPDLASRLRACTAVEIGEPDDALLAGVIAKLFADRQVTVDPMVITFMVRRLERSLATAINAVDTMDRQALQSGSKITRALAADVIDALDASQSALDV